MKLEKVRHDNVLNDSLQIDEDHDDVLNDSLQIDEEDLSQKPHMHLPRTVTVQ